MKKLISHLAHAKSLGSAPGLLRICLGNTSTDLDSCVGSILLSYLLTATQSPKDPPIVPVINGTPTKLKSLQAVTYHFENCGIPLDSLTYLADIDAAGRLAKGELEIVLYDHNVLEPSQELLTPAIRAIYDHHVDLTDPKNVGIKKKCITFCGSAISLVLNQPFDYSLLDFGIARFAVGPILIDTKNMNPALEKDRWNEIDVKALAILKPLFASEHFDLTAYYEALKSKKDDVAANLAQGVPVLLSKDYKPYKVSSPPAKSEIIFGASSIDVLLNVFVEHFGEKRLMDEYDAFCKARGLRFLIVLGKAGKDTRDFLVFSRDQELLVRWGKELESRYASTLLLKKFPHFSDSDCCRYYSHGDLAFTRKKQEPIWRDVVSRL